MGGELIVGLKILALADVLLDEVDNFRQSLRCWSDMCNMVDKVLMSHASSTGVGSWNIVNIRIVTSISTPSRDF